MYFPYFCTLSSQDHRGRVKITLDFLPLTLHVYLYWFFTRFPSPQTSRVFQDRPASIWFMTYCGGLLSALLQRHSFPLAVSNVKIPWNLLFYLTPLVAPHFTQGMHHKLFNLVTVNQISFLLTCLIWLWCAFYISPSVFSLSVSGFFSYIGVWFTNHHRWGLCQCNLDTRSFCEHPKMYFIVYIHYLRKCVT